MNGFSSISIYFVKDNLQCGHEMITESVYVFAKMLNNFILHNFYTFAENDFLKIYDDLLLKLYLYLKL